MTSPGIPNELTLSTSCFGTRLGSLEDQAFAAVAMGFRRLEIGLSDEPVSVNGFSDTERETGLKITSVVAGCLKPRSADMASMHLGSTDTETRERALNSVRRHIRLAQALQAPVVVVRGTSTRNKRLQQEAQELDQRIAKDGLDEDTCAAAREYTGRLVQRSNPEIEHLCRSLHTLVHEFPETRIALEPGQYLDDLLCFQAMEWVLDDLSRYGLGYWHDVGRIHVRERMGLPDQGQWLEAFAPRMFGAHLQDAAADQVEMPPGLGEVDFRMIANYLPSSAARVVEINPRHGRAQILEAIQFLVDLGV